MTSSSKDMHPFFNESTIDLFSGAAVCTAFLFKKDAVVLQSAYHNIARKPLNKNGHASQLTHSHDASLWQVLVRALQSKEDAVVQHYVCQTLDNLASQSNDHVNRLATYELVSGLMGVVGSAQVPCTLEYCKKVGKLRTHVTYMHEGFHNGLFSWRIDINIAHC